MPESAKKPIEDLIVHKGFCFFCKKGFYWQDLPIDSNKTRCPDCHSLLNARGNEQGKPYPLIHKNPVIALEDIL